MFNVYMDDRRMGPTNDKDYSRNYCANWYEWVICRSADQVKQLLELGLVNDLALDHDMARGDENDGTALVRWMCNNNCMPKGNITFHSENHIGIKNMQSLLDSWRRSKE